MTTEQRLQFLEGAVTGMRERLSAIEASHAADKAALAQQLRALADALDPPAPTHATR